MSFIKTYTKDEKTTKFIEQADVMIEIAMASSMKEVKTIVKQWKTDLNTVDDYRRSQTDTEDNDI